MLIFILADGTRRAQTARFHSYNKSQSQPTMSTAASAANSAAGNPTGASGGAYEQDTVHRQKKYKVQYLGELK